MAVFIRFDTNRCSSNRFDMNSDQILIKKFEKLFDLYRNYLFPDQSNSAKIYVVRYSSKNIKFELIEFEFELFDKVQTGIRLISILRKIRTQHRSSNSMSNSDLSPLPSLRRIWATVLKLAQIDSLLLSHISSHNHSHSERALDVDLNK